MSNKTKKLTKVAMQRKIYRLQAELNKTKGELLSEKGNNLLLQQKQVNHE